LATATSVTRTNNPEIDGLLGGTKWTGTITYSYPDSPTDYIAGYSARNEPNTGFSQTPAAAQAAIDYAVGLILSYTNASIQYAGTDSANIQIARSSAANPTSYAYYPSTSSTGTGGDVWFGTAYDYSQAKLGNYFFATALHELGHAFGLKHSQETGGVANVAVPAAHDDSEFTIMSYRSYVGSPLTGYTNEAFGYPQTYMANDILALQTLYGANYVFHSGNTVYSWSPATGQEFVNGIAQPAPGDGIGGSANRVFMTVWDGDGNDTYDLSNYATAVSINLNPGASSITSATQIAYLGNGHYAQGNVFNAYLYNGDARSYIDSAIGGTGDDTLVGNAIANFLAGGYGNDTLTGGAGNDFIAGGLGADTAVFSGSEASYLIAYNAATQTFTVADQRGGSPDGTDTLTGVESFRFADGVYASASFTGAPDDFNANGSSDILWIRDDRTVSIWESGQIGGTNLISGPGAIPGSLHIAGTGDFDGNGHDDILWRDDNGAVSIWDNGQPGAAHNVAAAGAVAAGWHIAGIGDFDGNGRSDILWLNDNGAASIWNNGQAGGARTVANPGGVPATQQVAGVGDFDGNGRSDILWRDDAGAVFIWDNGLGSGGHTVAAAGAVVAGWHIAGIGDFDGNGRSDIFWLNDNGAAAIWDNGQAGGARIVANPGGVPATQQVAGIGDYDGNGHSDILWRDDAGAVFIWDDGQGSGGHIAAAAGVVAAGWHIV
jgi:Ca2+-binding RTX toxin-like protein